MNHTEAERRCNALRCELKVWEKKFAAAHGGQKASREDIKADTAIAQKYKDYNRLRDVLSGKPPPGTPSRQAANRQLPLNTDHRPKSRDLPAITPTKRKRVDEKVVFEDVPSPAYILSPQGPTTIGPTPQRDGIVLGLFDILPAETPSKTRSVLGDVHLNVVQTPSRRTGDADVDSSLESRIRGEKTPLSAGKRFLLDSFVTPKKRKLGEQGTPVSALKDISTPAFLRRDNYLMRIDEVDEPTPKPLPWKRKGLGRSLSTIIQSMKQEEEHRFDEEGNIMRELEMEAEGIPMPKKQVAPSILVEDSQPAMPLGPDRGIESEDEEIEANEQDKPGWISSRIWKKKGLKRQTRRVIMRPHFLQSKPQPEGHADNDIDEDAVPETQITEPCHASDHEFVEDSGSEYASDASHSTKKRRVQKKGSGSTTKLPAKDGKQAKEGPVKAVARKIKATAHANYRRLTIKSKGGNGGKGRFGRRR